MTKLKYVPGFLTPVEAQKLFISCAQLPFVRRRTVPWNKLKRNAVVSFSNLPNARASAAGDLFLLSAAPKPIKKLAKKLTEQAGKAINYLSVVRYENGNDYMNWHQHKEDKQPGRDMSVWIVSTGAERPFAVRPLGGKGTKTLAQAGSLIILPSSFNLTHEHAVPKCNTTTVRYAVNCKHIPVLAETV